MPLRSRGHSLAAAGRINRQVRMDAAQTMSVASPDEGSDAAATTGPTIVVTEHGPYRVVGDVAIYDTDGTLLRHHGTWCLCRCGGSRNKPYCDVSHGLKGFDGAEAAD